MEMLERNDLLATLQSAPSRVEIYWNESDLETKLPAFWDRARQNLQSVIDRAALDGHHYDLTEVEDGAGILLILSRRQTRLPGTPLLADSPSSPD